MQSTKFESVWEILKGTSLNFETKVSETLKCTICKNILINAKQSACGCRFCEQCLSNYLISGKDNCPGDGEDCPLQLLSEKNVGVDNFANRKINELVVKCTNDLCEFKDCLKNLKNHFTMCQYTFIDNDNEENIIDDCDSIEESNIHCKFCSLEFKANEIDSLHYNIESEELCDQFKSKCPYECGTGDILILKSHIRVCVNKPSPCPYFEMGCDTSSIRQIEMSDHLCKSGFEHTKLLLEMITNLANEVKTNEINSIMKDKEIKEYKDKLDLVENENIFLRTDVNNTKMELDALKRMVIDLRDNRLSESGCNTDLNAIRSTVEKNECEISSIQRQLEQHNLKYEKVFTEYLWKIDHFSQLTQDAKDNNNRAIFSKPFFTSRNGYKLRMCCIPFSHHSGFISLTFQLMQSRLDEILEWPFKYDISISILDQNERNHKELHLFYDPSNTNQMDAYQKPEREFSGSYGFPEFMKRKILNSYPGYIKNDTVFVKFFAKPINLSE